MSENPPQGDSLQELAVVENGLEQKLEKILEQLRSFQGEDATKAADEFSWSEVTYEDPLSARRLVKIIE